MFRSCKWSPMALLLCKVPEFTAALGIDSKPTELTQLGWGRPERRVLPNVCQEYGLVADAAGRHAGVYPALHGVHVADAGGVAVGGEDVVAAQAAGILVGVTHPGVEATLAVLAQLADQEFSGVGHHRVRGVSAAQLLQNVRRKWEMFGGSGTHLTHRYVDMVMHVGVHPNKYAHACIGTDPCTFMPPHYYYYKNTCWAPHLEMNPKCFTMATV